MGPGFEVANDSKKVRRTICFAKDGCEPWINRSSAAAHIGSGRHGRSMVIERRQLGEVAGDGG